MRGWVSNNQVLEGWRFHCEVQRVAAKRADRICIRGIGLFCEPSGASFQGVGNLNGRSSIS